MQLDRFSWKVRICAIVVLLASLVVVSFITFLKPAGRSRPSVDALRVIADANASDEALKAAIQDILTSLPEEGSSFWLHILGEPTYSNRHRAMCLFAFVGRYCKPGSALRNISRLGLRRNWTDPTFVWEVTNASALPGTIDHDRSGTVLKWQPPICQSSHSAIYIALKGSVKVTSATSELRGRSYGFGHSIRCIEFSCPDWP
jgi:hypothetical protein